MERDEISQFIKSLKPQLLNVKRFLDKSGYEFNYPEEALPGVAPETESVVSRISSEIGEVPYALLEFYREIGSVNFCGHHKGWTSSEYSNPLVILPPEEALNSLTEYLDDREEHDKWYGGFRIPIGPDYFHKEDVSGGMGYGVAVPAESDNPVVLEEHHKICFIEYLELNISFGGFLGLEEESGISSWPLDKLREAAKRA
jgi:hypothetical protein